MFGRNQPNVLFYQILGLKKESFLLEAFQPWKEREDFYMECQCFGSYQPILDYTKWFHLGPAEQYVYPQYLLYYAYLINITNGNLTTSILLVASLSLDIEVVAWTYKSVGVFDLRKL